MPERKNRLPEEIVGRARNCSGLCEDERQVNRKGVSGDQRSVQMRLAERAESDRMEQVEAMIFVR